MYSVKYGVFISGGYHLAQDVAWFMFHMLALIVLLIWHDIRKEARENRPVRYGYVLGGRYYVTK